MFSSFSFANPPTVNLGYSFVFDRWCSQQTGIEVTQAERDRLINVFPKLQSQWDKTGPTLIEKTESIIKKPFLEKEMIVTVFLCKKTPSMSMPLLINGNWFVKDTPEPTDLVVDIIFHEPNFSGVEPAPIQNLDLCSRDGGLRGFPKADAQSGVFL